jgi:hypothetical protein
VSENSDEGEDDYWQPPAQRGIFGHGYIGSVEGPEDVCAGTADEQSALLSRVPGAANAEFWFYATASQGVLFTRAAQIDSKKRCSDALSFDFQIERALVADGIVHSMDADGDDLSNAQSRSATRGDGEYSGGFSTIHNLMGRAPLPSKGRRYSQRVAGLPADCAGVSGLVWHQVCISRRPGQTFGMILLAQAGDDERMMFRLEFDDVRPNVMLDGRLWQLDREWSLKE